MTLNSTRGKMAPMDSAIRDRLPISYQPPKSETDSFLQLAAQRLGTTPKTVEQRCYGPTNVFHQAAVITEAAVEVGKPEIGERLCHPIDVARMSLLPVTLDDGLWHTEQHLDGLENEAQVAFLLDPSPTTWDTYRRLLLKYIAHAKHLLAAGDAMYRDVV